jgi:hypothetical protein
MTAVPVRRRAGIRGRTAPNSQCSDVRTRCFEVARPTTTTIQICGLARFRGRKQVEIEIIAVVE